MSKGIKAIYNLTPTQEGMLYHKIKDQDSNSYHIQGAFLINEKIDLEIVRKVLDLIANKHEVLKTAIVIPKSTGVPWQAVLEDRHIELVYVQGNESREAEQIQEIKEADLKRGFDFQKDSLIRLTVVAFTEKRNLLLFSNHHIIMDGWCVSLVYGDFIKYYLALQKGESFEKLLKVINDEKIHYVEYAEYLRWLEKQDKEVALSYWKGLLAGYEEVADIKALNKPIAKQSQVEKEEIMLSIEETSKLQELAIINNVTMSTVAEATWGVVLQRYNYTHDVVFGKVVSGRNIPISGIEETVGLFINTVPVRINTPVDLSISELLQQVKAQDIKGNDYEYCALADIQSTMPQGSELIKTLFVFENYYLDEEKLNDGKNAWQFQMESFREQTNYPISISFEVNGKALNIAIIYDPNEYVQEEIATLLSTVRRTLAIFAQNPKANISELDIISQEQRHKILKEFNVPMEKNIQNQTIVDLWEEQVRKTPNNIALVYKEKALTYELLNKRINVLAYKIRGLGVKPNEFVAIMAQRSSEMIIGMYAVIKAGAAYVPIDPSYPEERIKYIFADCKPKAILTYKANINIDVPSINLEEDTVWEGKSDNLSKVNTKYDLAYCIYTSGTTGYPKGVMVEHKGIPNLRNYFINMLGITEADSILQFANIVFDASVWEMTMALLIGGKLVIATDEQRKDNNKFIELANREKISVATLPPGFYANLEGFKPRIIITAGSEATKELIEKTAKDTEYINAYGPTEFTVAATHWQYKKGSLVPKKIPIGKPILNTNIYILNGIQLCGVGMVGELCMAGEGVARGYLNKEELTKEKFIDNPFGEGKLYRSGDLARWLSNGEIDYMGRVDDQVKIRGFRIEIGEIEAAIKKVKNIKDATVVVNKDMAGEKVICAYIVSEQVQDINEFRNELGKILPNYMLPTYIMQIAEIPITRNGKVDKRALPQITNRATTEYIAPQNDIQEVICKVFKEILGRDKIGIKESFFEMGGHSLRATRVVNRLEAEFGIILPLKYIFKYDTAEKLSHVVTQLKNNMDNQEEYVPIPKAQEQEFYPMSSVQKRMYLIWQITKDETVYNMPAIFRLRGRVDVEAINNALNQIVARHEILRTDFLVYNSEFVQRIRKDVELDFEYKEDYKQSEKEIIQDFIRPFNLEKAPLLRGKLIKREDEYLFMFDMHHIVGDGMSMLTIINEFSTLYSGGQLECLTHQYKDYSEWMRQRDLSKQRAYWLQLFNDEIPILDMPLDYSRSKIQSYAGATIECTISSGLTKRIKEMAHKFNGTEYMVFLATAMIVLSKYSRQEDIIIGSPISGRTHRDMENMLGMFVNSLAMRGRPQKEKTYKTFLEEVRECCLKAYQNQEYPFDELVEAIDVNKDSSRNPVYDVMLAMQNNEVPRLKLKDIDIEYIPFDSHVAKFDMTFNIFEEEDSFKIELEYCVDLFRADFVHRVLNYYIAVLEQVTMNEEIKIADIAVINQRDKTRILKEFNDTFAEFPREKTVVQLFEEQVAKSPDRVALISKDNTLTYAQLNAKANTLAYKIREIGVKADDLIVIMAERNIETVVAILSVLKAGAAYVPIDPAYPKDRIDYIMQDCKPKVVITYTAVIKTKVPIIKISDVGDIEETFKNPKLINSPNDIAYVIYTSGTTGKPKGNMIEHKSILRLVINSNYTPLNEETAILQTGAISFDASTFEIFGAVLNGGSVYLTTQDVLTDAQALKRVLQENNINTMFITTALFNQLILSDSSVFDSLSYLLFGGEQTTEKYVQMLKERPIPLKLSNVYGPTETTTFATCYPILAECAKTPIGKPIANTQIYIMNGTQLCGIGVPGELCIAGEGLSRGYLNNEALTVEKFIENPFGEGKLYRSGDLARWLSDGNIEYLGRIDEQVKIRGFRIELGEVETALKNIEAVENAVVVVNVTEAGDKALYAYVVLKDQSITLAGIRNSLSRTLPDYMIPTYMMELEKIPVTQHGKLDKKALPKIVTKSEREYVAPTNEVEVKICEIFAEILGVERVGIEDNFFELGGDSIKGMRVITSLKSEGYQVSISDLFKNQNVFRFSQELDEFKEVVREDDVSKKKSNSFFKNTFKEIHGYFKGNVLEQLVEEVKEANQVFEKMITKGRVEKEYAISAIQEILKQKNILFSGTIISFKQEIDMEILTRSLVEIINAQPLLRSQLVEKDEQILIREFTPINYIKVPFIDLSKESNSAKQKFKEYIIQKVYGENFKWTDSMLERILYHVIVVKNNQSDWTLYMPFNHLIFDGMSREILKSTLLSTYYNNGKLKVTQKVISYEDYITNIERGPYQAAEDKLIDMLKLKDFNQGILEYKNKLEHTNFTNSVIKLRLNKPVELIDEEKLWNIAYRLFIKLLQCNFKQDRIPFIFLVAQRKYEDMSYYNTIGTFLDIVPVVETAECRIDFEYIKHIMQIMNDINLNFATLAYKDIHYAGYGKLQNELRQFKKLMKYIPAFNFLGLYSDENIDDLNGVNCPEKTEGIQLIVDVMLRGNEVIMNNAFYTDINIMTDTLQKYLDELLKKYS